MSDSDNTLKLLIEMGVIGKNDVLAANDLLKETGGGVDGLSDKTRNYIKTLDASEEPVKKFHLSHRNIRFMMRELIHGMPELGHIVSEMADPWLGLAFAVAVTAGKMIEYQKQIQEMESRPSPDWDGDKDRIEGVRKGYEDAAVSMAKFMDEMNRIENHRRSPQDNWKDREEASKRGFDIEKQLADAHYERDKKGMEDAEELGLISHSQAIAAKYVLDQSYANARIALEDKVSKAAIFAHKQELAETELLKHSDNEKLNSVEGGATKAKNAADANQKAIDTDKANLDKALEERKKIQEDLAELGRNHAHKNSADFGIWVAKKLGFDASSTEEAQKILEDKNEANEGAIGSFQKNISKRESYQGSLRKESDAKESEMEEIKAELKAATTRIAELRVSIPKETTADKETSAARHQVQSLKEDDVKGYEEAVAHGKKATAKQTEAFNSLIELMRGYHSIGDHLDSQAAALTDELVSLKNKQSITDSAIAALRQNLGQVARR